MATSKWNRFLFALGMGVIGAAFRAADHLQRPAAHSDFGPVWFGARALLGGIDPYPLVGPGLRFDFPFHLNYPATAMLLAMPLAAFDERAASAIFVAISAGLLAYGITKDGWQRAWIFLAPGFFVAAKLAQWTPLICATLFLPRLGWALPAKPNLGLAVAASTGDEHSVRATVTGALVLLAISLVLMPAWPVEWWRIVHAAPEFTAPVGRTGGFLVLAALLRWKQPEARWLLAFACVPQASAWYETMLPLLVARTKREMQILVFVSFLGVSQIAKLSQFARLSPLQVTPATVGQMMVMSGYLPALVVVLMRPNDGDVPAVMRMLQRAVNYTTTRLWPIARMIYDRAARAGRAARVPRGTSNRYGRRSA